jgi:GT2 family glycosyltransferase
MSLGNPSGPSGTVPEDTLRSKAEAEPRSGRLFFTRPRSSPLSVLRGATTDANQTELIGTASLGRVRTEGKFLGTDEGRFLVKGVTYGTFAPDADGYQFPSREIVAADFSSMSQAGFNTVRTYTTPSPGLLDEAATHGLRVMLGLWWPQHVAFLNDRRRARQIRLDVARQIRKLASHPAVLVFALGNEIPASVVRWHGHARIERFLQELYEEAKSAAPDSLFTYVNFPPTEYLELPFLDVCAFNVYLHREADLRAYVARLQHVAGNRPLLLSEAGADSFRQGPDGQAQLTAVQLRAAFEEGACGAIAFTWTDDWWCGGYQVGDWAFGLVDAQRAPKPALAAVSRVFADAPFPEVERARWPKVSVVVCAYNAAATLEDCLSSLERLTYPDYEVIVVNDGSRDATADIAQQHPSVKLVSVSNGGLSAARNIGLANATGEIVAYTDADVRVDPDWLTFLVQPFLTSDVVGAGGPNVVPPDDPPMAQCIARAPGGPTHVLLDDRVAEHVPGCNMAFRREALLAIDGFNPTYLRAGDDVDICWRLQEQGWRIGFAPAALVWHHHRTTLKQYWRQQVGYGEGETWLKPHHPDKFAGSHILWHGMIYSPLPFVRTLFRRHVNTGTWGTAAFPSVYRTGSNHVAFVVHTALWQLAAITLMMTGGLLAFTGATGFAALLAGAGLGALSLTVVLCIRCALATDIDSLPRLWRLPPAASRHAYHAIIAFLHLVQPFARLHGRLRGLRTPPPPPVNGRKQAAARSARPSLRHAWHALKLAGKPYEQQFWTESGAAADSLLTQITERLRAARAARTIEIDDGWNPARDVTASMNWWGWLDLRLLVENHGYGKCLARVDERFRPTVFGAVLAAATCVWVVLELTSRMALPVSAVTRTLATVLIGRAACGAWQALRTMAAIEDAVDGTMAEAGLQRLKQPDAREEQPGRAPTGSKPSR